jgi:hypothetical protein
MLVQPNGAPPQVAGAIRQAASSTGASFSYLIATAQIESNFNPQAQASTSSAQGLYQFIDQTWLATMKESGPRLGFGNFAANISRAADGRYEVPDPNARSAIMALRNNPKVSAMMAGAYAQNNAAQLADGLGRQPTEGELYIAHFLGADGAARLIRAAVHQPNTSAVSMFSQASGANRAIFFDKSGYARSAAEVYRVLTGKFENARANNAPAIVEVTGPLRGPLPADNAVKRTPDVAVAVSRVPDTAGIAKAYADAAAPMAYAATPPAPAARAAEPFFRSMFSDTSGSRGVSPMVRGLWTTPNAGDTGTRPVNLFTDIEQPSGKKTKSGS